MVAEAARSMATQVDNSAAVLIEAKATMRQVSESLTTMIEAATRSWQQYEERFDNVDQSLVRTINTVMENFKSNAEAVRDFVNKIDGQLGEAVSLFAGNIEDLQESAELLEKSTQSLEIASRAFVSQAAE
jgi:ABC-type transporter Mla subunit MlaD